VKLSRKTLACAGFGVLALLVALGGFLVVVKPQQSKVQSLDTQIAIAQAQYAALHTAGSHTPHLHAAELFQLSRAMPDNDDMPGILIELSHLANVSSVALTAVQPSPRLALTDGSSAVPLRVTIDGSWTNIAIFLRHVRNEVQGTKQHLSIAGRLFDIDNIQIEPRLSDTAPAGTIEAVLTMNAFDYGAPPSPTATAGASGATSTTTTTTTTTPSSGSQQAVGTGSGS
jgi:hypothetical protein